MSADIRALLERLRRQNEEDGEDRAIQIREDFASQIATLAPGRRRPLSPMLRERFAFAYEWENADLGQTWLGLDKIETALDDPHIRQCYELRIENWSRFPPAAAAAEDVAFYGVDMEEYDETYLVWVEGQEEPQIFAFFDANVLRFFDLRRYLEFLVGDREDDDNDPSMFAREG